MQITLTTENDLINYLNFLHQKDSLKSKFSSITLEGKEALEYIRFYKEVAFEDVEEETYIPNENYTEWNGKKRWSDIDINELGNLINEEYSIEHIATKMKRTPKAIRHQARNSYGMIYRNDRWDTTTNITED